MNALRLFAAHTTRPQARASCEWINARWDLGEQEHMTSPPDNPTQYAQRIGRWLRRAREALPALSIRELAAQVAACATTRLFSNMNVERLRRRSHACTPSLRHWA